MGLGMHRWLSAAVALWAAVACQPSAEPRLTGGAASIDALAAAYVGAVTDGDTAAMHALRVTEREYVDLVWVELPDNMPEYGWTGDFAWKNLDQRSRRDAWRIAVDHGGPTHDLRGVRCQGGVEDHLSFRLHRDCWLVIRDPLSGDREVKMFGSIVEMDGWFKVLGIVAG